jgi:hypothetical protein
MKRALTSIVGLMLMLVALGVSAQAQDLRQLDEFAGTNCEDEMAHLDNFAIQLQQAPTMKGVIIFYGGRVRGRLPKRGEAAARAARLKPYLVDRRGIPAERVTVINGGYAKEWHVELWIIPAEMTPPDPRPTVTAKEMRFRKGKVSPRDYRCRI